MSHLRLGNDPGDPNTDMLMDRHMANVYGQPVCLFEYLRRCYRSFWEYLRDNTALVVASDLQKGTVKPRQVQRDRSHWRYCGLLCSGVVLAFLWFMPEMIDWTVGVIAAMGVLCQWLGGK